MTKPTRRRALKLILASSAVPLTALAGEAAKAASSQRGTPTDPDLVNPTVPWPLRLSEAQLRTVTLLADLILPADDQSPAASAVGVPGFINEWVSAPYPDQQEDLALLEQGLEWLDQASMAHSGSAFHLLNTGQQEALCESIHDKSQAAESHQEAAEFFDRFRWLCMAGYYTTEAGRKDLGYIGNVPLPGDFPGATEEQKKFLGL